MAGTEQRTRGSDPQAHTMIDTTNRRDRSSFVRWMLLRLSRLIPLAKRGAIALGVVLVAALLGREIALNDQIAVILIAAVMGALMLAAPAGAWVIGALIVAIGFRALVELGVPGIVAFLDIPLAWGALVAALLRHRAWSPIARRHIRLLAALIGAIIASWIFHPTEAIRPLLYLALIAEPFALIGALLLDPPSPRLRRALVATAVSLVAIQIPLAIWQANHFGIGDDVTGSLYGAGAGAHVMSAVVVLGVIWLLAGGRKLGAWRYLLAVLMLMIPLLADAKQVLFALPVGAIALRWPRGSSLSWIPRIALLLGALVAVFILPQFAGDTAGVFLNNAASGRSGKVAVAGMISDELREDPESFLFGKGPAQTVSRSAFMTTKLLLKDDSPLHMFNLRPAEIAIQAQAKADAVSGGNRFGYGTSFNLAQSSALGLIGDIGVVGAIIFGSIVVSLFFALRAAGGEGSPEATAAAAGWAMFAVLGFIFDWWEQPPFTLFLAALSGLALAGPRLRDRAEATTAVVPPAPTTNGGAYRVRTDRARKTETAGK